MVASISFTFAFMTDTFTVLIIDLTSTRLNDSNWLTSKPFSAAAVTKALCALLLILALTMPSIERTYAAAPLLSRID